MSALAKWRAPKWRLGIFAAMIFVTVNHTGAQEISAQPTRGVRHLIEVSVKSDPDSQFLQQGLGGGGVTATLTLKTRISDHSQETNFYGDVPTTISNFDPIKGSDVQTVWSDAQCHHERGIPKVTLISVDGNVTSGQKKISIAARYRHIGLRLPEDEVMTSRRLESGTDKVGPFIAMRTETKQSRLLVDMKLYILPCALSAGVH